MYQPPEPSGAMAHTDPATLGNPLAGVPLAATADQPPEAGPTLPKAPPSMRTGLTGKFWASEAEHRLAPANATANHRCHDDTAPARPGIVRVESSLIGRRASRHTEG